MTSSFGKTLFRYLLLFSLLPTLALTLAGYFLATDETIMSEPSPRQNLAEVTDYYNQLLYEWLEREANTASSVDTLRDRILSFAIVNGSVELTSPSTIDSSTTALIRSEAHFRMSGIVEIRKQQYQYVRQDVDSGRSTIAVLIHGPEYNEMIETVQAVSLGRSARSELIRSYLYFAAVLFFVLGLSATVMSWYFSRKLSNRLSAPLMELSRASQKIAEGNFKQEVTTPAAGEIQTLILNFNAMARQLESTTQRLAQSERVAAWRHIARRFAHELKNPLQPILVSLYRLEKASRDGKAYNEMSDTFKAASQEVSHLAELADRFSQLAKLPPPKLEPVNLNEMFQQLTELYRDKLSPFDFRLELPRETVLASIDPTYFREALHNLLQNSIDASQKKAGIILSLINEQENITIRLRDFGSGMTTEVASNARIPYFTTKEKGSGLGLAIVEKTVSELSGELLIESQENQGTIVTIRLPRAVSKRSDG